MPKKVYFLFGIWLIIMLSIGVLFSSNEANQLPEQIKTHVNSSELLYFKNIRSFHYSIQSDDEKRTDIYRLKNIKKPVILTPIIVYLRPSREAFVLFENLNLERLSIQGLDQPLSIKKPMNAEENLSLALQLYKALEARKEIHLHFKDQRIKLEKESAKNLNTVLKDYFKLIGLVS